MVPEQQAIQTYISILERTNQQLSLWHNPYGLMVGILTLLIAFLAIAVSIALWRNSKDQRDRADKFFIDQERIINEKNENLRKIEGKFDDLIKEYEKQLKDTTKNKKEVQKIIDEIKQEKAKLAVNIGPYGMLSGPASIIASPNLGYSVFPSLNLNQKSMVCAKCGESFNYQGSYTITLSPTQVYCTHCGALNIP